MTNQFCTYLHCKPDGTPFYVGKGVLSRPFEFCRRNKYHQNIVKKYGKENISIFVFLCDSEEQALSDEVQQIAQLRLGGYKLSNLTDGGEGTSGTLTNLGRKLSVEHKEKIAKSLTGKHCSEETKKKLSERVMTDEWRTKISVSKMGNKNSVGVVRSEESKERARITALKDWAKRKEEKANAGVQIAGNTGGSQAVVIFTCDQGGQALPTLPDGGLEGAMG